MGPDGGQFRAVEAHDGRAQNREQRKIPAPVVQKLQQAQHYLNLQNLEIPGVRLGVGRNALLEQGFQHDGQDPAAHPA